MARAAHSQGLTKPVAFRTLLLNPFCLRLHVRSAAPAAEPRKRGTPTRAAPPRESPSTAGRTLSQDCPRARPGIHRNRSPESAGLSAIVLAQMGTRPLKLSGVGAGSEPQRIPIRTRSTANDGTQQTTPLRRENGPPNHTTALRAIAWAGPAPVHYCSCPP